MVYVLRVLPTAKTIVLVNDHKVVVLSGESGIYEEIKLREELHRYASSRVV